MSIEMSIFIRFSATHSEKKVKNFKFDDLKDEMEIETVI